MGFSKQSKINLCGVVLIGLLCSGTLLMAQDLPGRLWVNVLAPDKSFKDRPYTVSAVCDGKIVYQQDGSLEAPPNKDGVRLDLLPLGLCDVRVESEGLVTEVKRGVQVFDRDRTVEIAMKAGEGVHIVELAEGGLAREEVAARLRALEASVEQLKKAISSLSQHPQQ